MEWMAMMTAGLPVASSSGTPPDAEIVARVRAGDTALFEILMRRHNQRVYRVIRAVLRDESDVEDAMQQAYINAFTHLGQFEDRAQFSTWLTRIALHEALARRRRAQLHASAPLDEDGGDPLMTTLAAPQADPERETYAGELRRALETAVDALPERYRTVFMLRDVEGLSTAETAEGLQLHEEAVKTRLHRARGMVKRTITEQLGAAATEAFHFHAVRCDRVVANVLEVVTRRN
jgi:RNA polymerase sigma-70 factor (ECF subfamily)